MFGNRRQRASEGVGMIKLQELKEELKTHEQLTLAYKEKLGVAKAAQKEQEESYNELKDYEQEFWKSHLEGSQCLPSSVGQIMTVLTEILD